MKLEHYEITIARGGKTLRIFKTDILALIGLTSGTTLCDVADWEIRLLLASRVQLYLESLKKTIISDARGVLNNEALDDLIKLHCSLAQVDEECINLPETAAELIARLKREN